MNLISRIGRHLELSLASLIIIGCSNPSPGASKAPAPEIKEDELVEIYRTPASKFENLERHTDSTSKYPTYYLKGNFNQWGILKGGGEGELCVRNGSTLELVGVAWPSGITGTLYTKTIYRKTDEGDREYWLGVCDRLEKSFSKLTSN